MLVLPTSTGGMVRAADNAQRGLSTPLKPLHRMFTGGMEFVITCGTPLVRTADGSSQQFQHAVDTFCIFLAEKR